MSLTLRCTTETAITREEIAGVMDIPRLTTAARQAKLRAELNVYQQMPISQQRRLPLPEPHQLQRRLSGWHILTPLGRLPRGQTRPGTPNYEE